MIVNGGSYRAIGWWADHLQSKDNDRAGVVKSYGLRSEDIRKMLFEMEAHAQGTRCENFFYQMNLNPALGERLTEEQWDKAREIAEKKHGLEGQPYFVVEHVKHGRPHQHIVWSRIDLEAGRAISDSNDAKKNHAIAREIEREFGLEKVVGPYDREQGTPRPPRAPEPWEMYRGMKTGIDPRDIAAEVTELFHQSDSGKALQAALELHGYQLLKGDRRGFVILDSAGKDHSLARRIDGVNAKELTAFMRDVDCEGLPTVEHGKAQFQERKIAGLAADRATVAREIEWEEALAKSAIEKEKATGQFLAPEDREKEQLAAQQQREAGSRKERHWPIEPARPERKSPGAFEQAATEAGHDSRPDRLRGVAAQVWNIWTRTDHEKRGDEIGRAGATQVPVSFATDPKAFAATLDEKGIMFAAVTKEEATQSHREAEFAKAVGNHAPRYREGETVIVTEPRPEYRREGEIVVPRRVHKLDQSLGEKFVSAIGQKGKLQGIEATLIRSDERAYRRSEERESILEAAQARSNRRNFVDAVSRSVKPAKIATNGIRVGAIIGKGTGKALEVVGGIVEGLLGAAQTPEQKRDGDAAIKHRADEAADHIDFSKYTTEAAQQRRQEQHDREAERSRDRGGRER